MIALYQHDLTSRPLADLLPSAASRFTRELVEGVEREQPELDALIEGHAKGWTLDRIAPLERAILRAALLEMRHPEITAGERPIPPEGAIDEAVELAKAFCGSDAPKFVNGVLAAALRDGRDRGEIGRG